MAASLTKRGLAEQIIRIIKGSDNPLASSIEFPEVFLLIGQVVNKLLKIEAYTQMNEGDIPPNGLALATYDNQAVSAYKTDYSKVTLPAVPVRLPKNMGVFHISKTDDPFNPFIPIPSGMFGMIRGEAMISDLLGQIGYEVNGNQVIFTKNLLAESPAVSEVLIRLVVLDVSQLTEYDPLPIPADFEIQVITGVLEILGIKQKPDNKVDPISETK